MSGANRTVCVIGAGCAGLAAVKTLTEREIPVVCFEQGSGVGGNWRYENDSGASGAYGSLRCNVSRRRMQYPSFPMPASYGDFPSHADMTAYFDAYADAFRLRPKIRFSTRVERIEPAGGAWRVALGSGEVEEVHTVVVANGHHWDPKWPEWAGASGVQMIHSREYRRPEPFAGKRVLVVGAGQSAVEIGIELGRVASRTLMSVRTGAHVLPRMILGSPFDSLDLQAVNRLPWRLLNSITAALVRASRAGDPAAFGFRRPPYRVLEHIPVVSSELLPALGSGAIAIKSDVACLDGSRVRFADGSTETVDAIVCATGYRIRFPFLSPSLLEPRGTELPLYRRIVPLDLPGLYFIGLVDAPAGLLPIVERQSEWLADLLLGRIELPSRAAMLAAIAASERRTRQRFPREPAQSIRCDPHAYVRLLSRDRRRAAARSFLTYPSAPLAAMRARSSSP